MSVAEEGFGMNNAESDAWRKAAISTGECLSIEDLDRYRLADFPPERMDAARAHLAACPRCDAELELLTRFQEASPSTSESDDAAWVAARLKSRQKEIFRPESQARSSGWESLLAAFRMRGAAAALASLVVVAGVAWLYRRPSAPELDPGAVAGPGVYRSDAIEVLGPLGDAASAPSLFRWTPHPGAASYEIRLLAVDKTELWKGSATAPPLAVPDDARRAMSPSRTLFWEVRAFDGSGAVLAQSGLREFKVAAR